ncbi:hypothetical protein NDU88_002198 [Pleurodeles waltl]|uniref:Uncharacterized protein n=1 Tax=Pleurodeles waltl TaxID=8319 RepID=A0AAV7P993_PLEWA|nr:hypothetical protein NDU88_002198 [Pleurodeles waltl]
MDIQRRPAIASGCPLFLDALCTLAHRCIGRVREEQCLLGSGQPTSWYRWRERERQEESLCHESKGYLCESRETGFSLAPLQAAPGRAASAMVCERDRGDGNSSRGHIRRGFAASCYDGEAPRSPGPRDADPECCPSRVPVRLQVIRV